MYERHDQPLLTRRQFALRLLRHFWVAAGMVLLSLFAGMLGYHLLEGFSWLDAFLNAAMILGGMGPVTALQTPGGKLFAGLYALYSGLLLLAALSVLLLPVLHRLLHSFHLNDDDDQSAADTPPRKVSQKKR